MSLYSKIFHHISVDDVKQKRLDNIIAEKLRLEEKLEEQKRISMFPVNFARGMNWTGKCIILDEAQNATPMQMKMFLTRLGVNSKAIITGDITQIDLPKNSDSGLIQVVDILKGIDGIGLVKLNESDVVRHKLVQDIIRAYDKTNKT